MSQFNAQIKKILPSNKFTAPSYDKNQHLFREAIIPELIAGKWANKNRVLIQAQAGQGKTTIALQLIDSLSIPFTWYQIGPEDHDPILMLSSLYVSLYDSLPEFSAPIVQRRLESGNVPAYEAEELLKQLNEELAQSFSGQHFIIFDDLHLLREQKQNSALLGNFIVNLPPEVRVLALARSTPVEISSLFASPKKSIIIKNNEIAFSHQEIFKYFNDILNKPTSTEEIKDIHNNTEGWVSGIKIYKNNYAKESNRLNLNFIEKSHIDNYFIKYIEDNYIDSIEFIFLVSMLDSVDIDLILFLDNKKYNEIVLKKLLNDGFFISYIENDETKSYKFHQLFKDSLQKNSIYYVTIKDKINFLNKTARWFLETDKPFTALKHFLSAQNFEASHKILQEFGLIFISQNLHSSLYQHLKVIPLKAMEEKPWFFLFLGIVAIVPEPEQGSCYLECAREKCAELGDSLGELFALSQLTICHLGLDANYKAAANCLPRLVELFQQYKSKLDDHSVMHISLAVSLSYVFVRGNAREATNHLQTSYRLAEKLNAQNELSLFYIVSGYIHHIAGNWQKCRETIESFQTFLLNPIVSNFNKLYLLLFQLDFLHLSGDFHSYQLHSEKLKEFIEKDLLAHSVAGSFLTLWEIDIAFAQGEYESADILLEHALSSKGIAAQAHLRSQYLQYAAFLAIIRQQTSKALQYIEESKNLRDVAGGQIFIHLNQMFIAIMHAHAGNNSLADEYFDLSCRGFETIGDQSVLVAVFFHKAYSQLNSHQTNAGIATLSQALELSKHNSFKHFYGWTPEMMGLLLQTAIDHNVLPDYSASLASERLGLVLKKNKEAQPILHIKTLGTLELSIGDNKLQLKDLTEIQRNLLGELICSPNNQQTQEMIQTKFWPDVENIKGRKRFDTALGRLREKFAVHLKIDPNNYLNLKSGLLSLANCRLDNHDFMVAFKEGTALLKEGKNWQAGNAFFKALDLWHGPFLSSLHLENPAAFYRNELEQNLLDLCIALSLVLVEAESFDQALFVAQKGLREDPVSIELNRIVYNCHIRLKQPLKAARLLQKLESDLSKEEYLTEDVQSILESFWT